MAPPSLPSSLLVLLMLAVSSRARIAHTVSGLSSGAFMAVQHHIAYSTDVDAVGVVAGGPYWCANANVDIALTACMKNPALINLSELVAITHSTAATGFIDPVTALRGDRVLVYSGELDSEVHRGVVEKTVSYYEYMGVAAEDIVTVYNISSAHAMVTESYGRSCDYFGEPYIVQCGYDLAGRILQEAYPSGAGSAPLAPPVPFIASHLVAFDQAPYGALDVAGLGGMGYVYVPTGCESAVEALQQKASAGGGRPRWPGMPAARCRLHVVYHGCHQAVTDENNVTFVTHAGYNGWAEANAIVILYPQARSSRVPYNPKGCWDWWGYSGPQYASKKGLQMVAVRRMVEALTDML